MALFLYFLLMIIASGVIWFQTVAPLRFKDFLDNNTFIVYCLSFLTGVVYIEAIKIGSTIFPTAWALRFVAFSINTICFGLLTHFFIAPDFSSKTVISLSLCILIILVQAFWKD